MTDTSYNPSYVPYAKWSVQQAPVPATVHNMPASIAGSSAAQSSLIATEGFSLISAGVTASQAGTMSIQRYLDAGGTVPQGAPVQIALAAATAANLDILDGKPFASFKLTITNASGSTSNLTNFALLLQTANPGGRDNAVDGSTSISSGGVAQKLFGGGVPVNGFSVSNPDPTNDLWISDSTTAVANGQGSIRVSANGGYYATETGQGPMGVVSVIGSVTSQKITARRW